MSLTAVVFILPGTMTVDLFVADEGVVQAGTSFALELVLNSTRPVVYK